MFKNIVAAVLMLITLAGCMIVPLGWGHGHGGGHGHGDRHWRHR